MALGRMQRVIVQQSPGAGGDLAIVAAIAASGSGVNAVPAQKICVLGGIICCSAAGMNPKFRSATSDTTFGALPLAANGAWVMPLMGDEDEYAWFETNAGEALNINVAAAGTIGGTLFVRTRW